MSSGVAVRVWSPGTHVCATCCRAGCLTHSVSVEGCVCGCEDVPLSSVCARFTPACLWKGGGKRSWICLRRAPWLHPSPPPSILMQSGGGEGKGGHNPAAVFRHQWDEWVLLPTDWREPDMPSGHGHIPSDAPSVDCLPGTVYPRASRKLQGCFHCVYETLWCVQCVSPELVCTCLRTLLVHRRGLLQYRGAYPTLEYTRTCVRLRVHHLSITSFISMCMWHTEYGQHSECVQLAELEMCGLAQPSVCMSPQP